MASMRNRSKAQHRHQSDTARRERRPDKTPPIWANVTSVPPNSLTRANLPVGTMLGIDFLIMRAAPADPTDAATPHKKSKKIYCLLVVDKSCGYEHIHY